MAVIWKPKALENFRSLVISMADYAEDEDLADRLLDSLEAYLEKISDYPLSHKQADGFPKGTFQTNSRPFVVCYERTNGDLEVVAVYHEKSLKGQ